MQRASLTPAQRAELPALATAYASSIQGIYLRLRALMHAHGIDGQEAFRRLARGPSGA